MHGFSCSDQITRASGEFHDVARARVDGVNVAPFPLDAIEGLVVYGFQFRQVYTRSAGQFTALLV